jgi:hypothetical protein
VIFLSPLQVVPGTNPGFLQELVAINEERIAWLGDVRFH